MSDNHNMLLFVCVTLLVWGLIVSFMVREKHPGASNPYMKMAMSRRGLMVLLGAAVLSYFLFLNHHDKDLADAVRPAGNTYDVSKAPAIPGPSAMVTE